MAAPPSLNLLGEIGLLSSLVSTTLHTSDYLFIEVTYVQLRLNYFPSLWKLRKRVFL
jgi:hypothetical protein